VDYAADISGVSTTLMQIGGAVSVAGFGTLYLALSAHATNAFGITTIALAVAALTASLSAYRATRQVPAPHASPTAVASAASANGV
jgi:hypothetical protein